MSKIIQLKGAALEAAQVIYKASQEYNRDRKNVIEVAEREFAAQKKHLDTLMAPALAIIREATGVDIAATCEDCGGFQHDAGLDLRYMPVGLAFVNIDTGDSDGERVEVGTSQHLS